VSKHHGDHNDWAWCIYSQAPILDDIAAIVKKETSVECKIHTVPDDNSRNLVAKGNCHVEIVLNWLYEGASVYLARKHATYQKFLGERASFRSRRASQSNEAEEDYSVVDAICDGGAHVE
jgi:hypothetical protein